MSWLAGTGLTAEAFQQSFWRQKPTPLGKHTGLATLGDKLTPERLLRLAGDASVEARLITPAYALQSGPFDLESLPNGQMLMLQDLDALLPEVNDMLTNYFAFLPRWRIDDVMATLANCGGNCGAHFDYYDVFLVQVRGQKSWQLDDGGHGPADMKQDTDIRLLKAFSPTLEIEQQAGDILYIPPGTGHHGVASDDSVTLSVGIRNPTVTEMVSHLADLLIDMDLPGRTLDDGIFGQTLNPEDLLTLQSSVLDVLKEPGLATSWYGSYMTRPRNPELVEWPKEIDLDGLLGRLEAAKMISCTLAARLAHVPLPPLLRVFAMGEQQDFEQTDDALEWLSELESARQLSVSAFDPTELNLSILLFLVAEGAVSLTTTGR